MFSWCCVACCNCWPICGLCLLMVSPHAHMFFSVFLRHCFRFFSNWALWSLLRILFVFLGAFYFWALIVFHFLFCSAWKIVGFAADLQKTRFVPLAYALLISIFQLLVIYLLSCFVYVEVGLFLALVIFVVFWRVGALAAAVAAPAQRLFIRDN